MWGAMVRVSAATCIAIHMTSTVATIEDFVEGAAAEELSENFFWVAEHEREPSEDEIVLERVVLMSSAVMVAIVSFIVS